MHLAGQLPDGALYIVMEYLDGLSLQSALAAAGGAVPLPRALHIALQICDAVGEAHAQGIVHRDLKPENVMLVRRGEDADFVKVLDFGIARLDWGEQSMATAAGLIFGTARYISPEGAQGEQVGPEGDVYAIATLLYQMLAGRTPFEGDQAVALLVQQIHDAAAAAPLDPAVVVRARSRSRASLMANLAKDKSKRAPDARSLGRALLEAAKTAGLSPEDLVPRSMLLGARGGASSSSRRCRGRDSSSSSDRSTEMLQTRASPQSAPALTRRGARRLSRELRHARRYEPPRGAARQGAARRSRSDCRALRRSAAAGTQKWVPPPARASADGGRPPTPRWLQRRRDDGRRDARSPPPAFSPAVPAGAYAGRGPARRARSRARRSCRCRSARPGPTRSTRASTTAGVEARAALADGGDRAALLSPQRRRSRARWRTG